MDAVEAIGEALHILFARLETLRNLDETAMLFPEKIQPYEVLLKKRMQHKGGLRRSLMNWVRGLMTSTLGSIKK